MTATAHVISFFLLFMTELAAIIAVIPHTAEPIPNKFIVPLFKFRNEFKTLIKIKIKTKFKIIIKKEILA